MTVKELIEHLQSLNSPDMEVVMSKDAEGNEFSPLSDADQCLYRADTTWGGECFRFEEALDDGWDEETLMNLPTVICLWPTN